MSWLDGLRYRLGAVLRPGRYEAELLEEMRLHQALEAEAQGDFARARRRFGNETWYLEETRRMTWLGAMDTLRQDAGYALRSVARSPGLTLVIVLTLALGIGVNAAMFTLLDRLYLSPPGGISEAGTLRRLWVEHFNSGDGVPFASQALNHPMFRLLADATGEPERVAVYTGAGRQRLGIEPDAPTARSVYASSNLFGVLGVRPLLGRFYTAEEDRLGAGAELAVISHAFWQRRFGGDPGVLGATLPVGARTFTVIGVTAPSFTGLELQPADVWLPIGAMPVREGAPPWWESLNMYSLRAVMRVSDVASAGAYAARATSLMRDFNREHNASRPDTLMNVHVGSIIEARGPGRKQQELTISTRLGGVSAIVLLIACANVINLLLARAVQRRRENAVRLALGISRWRMIRLVCIETLLLAAMAGAGALVAASWGGSLLRSLLLPDIEWVTRVLDVRVALFTFAIALLAGLVAGIVPAVQSSRTDITSSLKAGAREGVRHRSRLRSGLVVVQAALSVMLLVGATLFVRSLRNVQNLDIGYDASRIIYGGLTFPLGQTPPTPVYAAAMREVAERLQRRPGVESVARSNLEPMRGISFIDFYTDTDSSRGLAGRVPTLTAVSPEFFRTVGLRVVRGRVFESRDGAAVADEVVINEAMARLLWPAGAALWECMYFEARANPCYRVVGIVEDARRDRIIEAEPAAQFYLPLGRLPVDYFQGTSILVRAEASAAATAAAELRTELQRAFPGALPATTPFLEYLEPQYRPWRLGATLFTAFGLLALLVALVGIYTTVSYGVSQRTHEFGVRMALGARVRDVLRQVVGEGLRTVALGVLVGVGLALAGGRLIATLLYGVQPHDPLALTLVGVSLLAVAALAAVVPAWRAARVDPLTTLRSD